MNTKNEKSQNEQYLIWGKNKIRIVTHKSNVMKEVQDCADSTSSSKIMELDKSVTDEKFAEFVRLAKKEGFAIYKIFKM